MRFLFMVIKGDKKVTNILHSARAVLRGYEWKVAVLTGFGFISALLEGIGINAVIPLLSMVTDSKNYGDDAISQFIRGAFEYLNISFSLKYLLTMIVILFTFKAIFTVISNYLQGKILADYEKKSRNKLYHAVIKAKWDFLMQQKIGYLEAVLKNDIAKAGSLLRRLSVILSVIISLVVYIAVAINISFTITLVTLIIGAFIFLIFKPLIYRGRMAAGEEEKIYKSSSHFINENVLGLKTIKSMLIENQVIKKANGFFESLRKIKVRMYLLSAFSKSLLQPISIIFIAIVFAVSYKIGGFNLAALVAVIYLIQRIFQYMQQLVANLHNINELAPYAQTLIRFNKLADENIEREYGNKIFKFEDKIRLNNISFHYTDHKQILKNINFEIKKGEMVGLIGPSGAGKTTIVDLMLRLLKPQDGKILCDEVDINQIKLYEWRSKIGYISQDIFLINDSIENNIKFYDKSITHKKMIEAAKMANIYQEIQELENGFKSIIGERGIFLSAGQRQRVVIARILAREPEILIMDEATSALDNESEVKIQKIINQLKGKITVLVIAHRLSTIMDSDKLLVLENGSIVEQGNPNKLVSDKDSYFYKVYNIRE